MELRTNHETTLALGARGSDMQVEQALDNFRHEGELSVETNAYSIPDRREMHCLLTYKVSWDENVRMWKDFLVSMRILGEAVAG